MLKSLILSLCLILTLNCAKADEKRQYNWPLVKFSGEVKVKVEIAKTEEERNLGLMFRRSLKEGYGMLFVFEKEDYQSFWMKNCFFPLDLIFIDRNGKIVDIKENFEPCKEDPCPSYQSKEKAKFVLEVNAGFCKKNKIKLGQTCKLPPI